MTGGGGGELGATLGLHIGLMDNTERGLKVGGGAFLGGCPIPITGVVVSKPSVMLPSRIHPGRNNIAFTRNLNNVGLRCECKSFFLKFGLTLNFADKKRKKVFC